MVSRRLRSRVLEPRMLYESRESADKTVQLGKYKGEAWKHVWIFTGQRRMF